MIGWSAGREGAKRAHCRLLPNITPSEAHCQVDRGINAIHTFDTNTKNYDEPKIKKTGGSIEPPILCRHAKIDRKSFAQLVVGFAHKLVCAEQVVVGTFLFLVCLAICGRKKRGFRFEVALSTPSPKQNCSLKSRRENPKNTDFCMSKL